MKISKLFPLYPADIAMLEVQRIMTISQIFETHLSGRIDKSISPELMTSLTLYPVLQHKLKVFMRALLHQLFHNKYSCPRSNLAILANLDINLSRKDQLKICELLDTSVGVAPAYHTRIQDNIAIRPSQRDFTTLTVFYNYRPSLLKSIAPFGQTTRRSNPECDRTQTVSAVTKRSGNSWSTSSVNASTTQSHCGAN
jgi:hypothetical protein